MEELALRIMKLNPRAYLPSRATPDATGLDVYACLDELLALGPKPAMVPAGIAMEFPRGLDVQVRPRSGLSAKGVGVAFGTIDADYRGELLVTMWTFGGLESYELHHGDRIAQLVVARLAAVRVEEVGELSQSSRGASGHGSTGR
jgi:dUTP pyrophosphatase